MALNENVRYFHSVTLDREKCKGCTTCIKRCPTEAIRVRDGKARIMEERCIDCGECIRICPNRAKVAVSDPLSRIREFDRAIALPAPAIFGQFEEDVCPDAIIQAFLDLGFHEVFEVAVAAEALTLATRDYILRDKGVRPLISSACPAVIRLMQVRFPSLLENIIPLESPMEVAARMSKAGRSGSVGAFFISPCPAKVTAVKQPVGSDESQVDGAISFAQIYPEILKRIPRATVAGLPRLRKASAVGIYWGRSGGEAMAIGARRVLAVDGIHSVIAVLDEVERGRLSDIDYIEAQACVGGCIGGCLMALNPFLARVRMRALRDKLAGEPLSVNDEEVAGLSAAGVFDLTGEIKARPVMALDEDVGKAISKMQMLEKTLEELPGLDCGSCGSPSCRSLAEDIVRGTAVETDCVFKLRERVQALAEQVVDLARRIPPAMGTKSGTTRSERRTEKVADAQTESTVGGSGVEI